MGARDALATERRNDVVEGEGGVSQGLGVLAAHRLQPVGEGGVPLQLGSQGDRIDEEADALVEGRVVPPPADGAEHEVRSCAEAREQSRDCSVHHHEQGGPPGTGQALKAS